MFLEQYLGAEEIKNDAAIQMIFGIVDLLEPEWQNTWLG